MGGGGVHKSFLPVISCIVYVKLKQHLILQPKVFVK